MVFAVGMTGLVAAGATTAAGEQSESARAAGGGSVPYVHPAGFYACWSPWELEAYAEYCDRGGDCSVEEWAIILEPYAKWKTEGEKVPNAYNEAAVIERRTKWRDQCAAYCTDPANHVKPGCEAY